ncbi:YqaJ viral recombinase family protein [Acidovorax sp. K2F]|uniref:YqaJ viral recombinase family protein n=1 Tax=Acidovorax sp. K2F TaxID=2978125 RepID=UPI0021B0CE20|nr:YqaJ viral recombinase family protein [Acidovorax sp. K2F]MCT6719471.1 YqaJ viral recombinase family protein [Acidovorax sp. K2F]
MTMIVHDVQQGTNQWHSLRAEHFTASEAPAMMSVSPYLSRDELLKQKALRLVDAEIDSHKAALFQAGHDAEAGYRPIAEAQIDDDLYNITGTRDVDGLPLLASFDGLTMDRTIGFEHKLWSNKVAAQLADAGEPAPHHYWQLEQQLLVSGAKRIMFATSDGTDAHSAWVWYESKPERRAQLIAGWKQFSADLAAYVPPEAAPAPVVAAPVETLPAVSVRVDGQLAIVSNLPAFGAALRNFIDRIPTAPSTDQEFADTEAACKALKQTEDALEAAESNALAQLADVDTMRRFFADYRALARTTRLQREKLVALRKEEIRGEIVAGGIAALREHIASLNTRLGKPYMPQVPADFNGVIKGKRTVDSLRGAVNDELARAKIEASAIADRIQINLGTMRELASAHAFLFADTATIVLKQPEDLTMLVKARVAEHQAAEQTRLEAERERIRREEADRADREAREKLAAEERAAQAAITQAAKAEALHPAVAADLGGLVREQHAEAVATLDAQQVIGAAQRAAAAPQSAVSDTANLLIGAINTQLGYIVNAAFLAELGFHPARVEGARRFYRDSDMPLIGRAIAQHTLRVTQLQTA